MEYDDMNMVCLTDEQLAFVEAEKKKAVKEFAEKLKEQYSMFGNTFAGWISFIPCNYIDELLEKQEECK